MIVVTYILHHEVIGLLIRNEEKRLKYYVRSVQLTIKLGLKLLGIKPVYRKLSESKKGGLIVSNHLSYIDILVLFAEYPALFITSQEIKETFLLGHLTSLAGCFHVERRKALRTRELMFKELSQMKEKLAEGFNLFLFPEGTSSNGETVLPFKAHFFQTAMDLNLPVTALCLKYDWEGAHPDEICWYGEMGFAGHLFNLCCRPQVKATVTELAFEIGVGQDRYEVASKVQSAIKEVYERH